MSDNDEITVHRCPEWRFSELEKRVDKFARRAAKLGKPALSVEVVGEETKDIRSEVTGEVIGCVVYKLFVVHGEAPVVAGHTFVASIEHTSAGNIMFKAPGCESVAVPAELRDGPPTCDHCKTNRRRKDTFLLRKDETGELIRVGRNCLADFLRTTDAAEALRLWTLLREIKAACGEDEPSGGWGGSGYVHTSTVFYVACVIRSIALHGWTSRGEAYQRDEVTATANDANFACSPCFSNDPTVIEEWKNAQPTKEDSEEAKKAVEWARELTGDSDYEHNLKVACSLDYVKGKNKGLVASAAYSYRRHVERELKAAREAARAAVNPSGHFGKVKSRYVRKLTVTHSNSWENEYGVTVLYVMEDEVGNKFKWFSSGGCWMGTHPERRELKVGDTFYFTFAVKSHGEWKGVEETTIVRATPSEESPVHKWVNAEGEVFKTKKAMKAAEVDA